LSPLLNTRARLLRATRNNVKIHSIGETVGKSKWLIIALVILLPVYPSLSFIWRDANAHGADYDESTIITAYSDVVWDESRYISDSWLLTLDIDSSSKEVVVEQKIEKIEKDSKKKLLPIITQYTVVTGDTLAKLSTRYDVSVDAIQWANDLRSWDTLKPGMILKIPPISGVIHRVVRGDTLSEIAMKYKIESEDIIRVNRLSDAASLRIGTDLVIPWAVRKATQTLAVVTPKKPEEKKIPIPTKTPTKAPVTVSEVTGLKSSYAVEYTWKSRGFVWGNCTWYVAQYKSVSWRWNANQWLKNAKSAWVKTGQTPVPGAIVQFSGRGYNRYYGHVWIVADVTDDHIIVKDMNYRSTYEVTIRKVPRYDVTIDGYIYVD
jgi:surface antigen